MFKHFANCNDSNFNRLVASHFWCRLSPGMLGVDEYAVVYPPNGIIPFHGFAMYGKYSVETTSLKLCSYSTAM